MFTDKYDITNRSVGRDFWAELSSDLIYKNGPVRVLQYDWEFRRFLELIPKKLANVLEIGSDDGGTLYQWKSIMYDGGNLVSVSYDANAERIDKWKSWFPEKNIDTYVYTGDSHDQSALDWVNHLGLSFDMLFIDGDHTYEGAKKDFLMYGPLVRESGIIVLHDIIFTERHVECRVDLLWDEIKQAGYKTVELYASKQQSGLGIGIVYI